MEKNPTWDQQFKNNQTKTIVTKSGLTSITTTERMKLVFRRMYNWIKGLFPKKNISGFLNFLISGNFKSYFS